MALKAEVCGLGLGILGLVEAAEGRGAAGRGRWAEAKEGRLGKVAGRKSIRASSSRHGRDLGLSGRRGA